MKARKENAQKLIPARIRQARISRGLSLSDLADMVEVSKQAVSQYELGTSDPSDAVLLRITDILKYPVSFFHKPFPSSQNYYSSSVTFFRSRKTTNAKLKDAAEEKLKLFYEIDDCFRNYVNFPDTDIPKIDLGDAVDEISEYDIENLAIKLREHWGLGTGPIPNLMSIIQQKGFMVSRIFLGNKKIDAFSKWFNNVPYIFLGSDKQSAVRSRFDISHELGHLLMHTHLTEKDLDIKMKNDSTEGEADRFAAALLLPADSFGREVNSSSINHFIMLKKKWKASISCMIKRCSDLNLLTENQITYLKNQMTKNCYWRSEPLDDTLELERPYAHKQAVNLLIENNILSAGDIVEAISCYPEEIENYCFLEKGTLTPKIPNNLITLKEWSR